MNFSFYSIKNIKQIPSSSGVYCFKEKNKILYIGKARNLKERIKQHFNQPSFKNSHFLKRATSIGIIQTKNEIDALLLESHLIKKHSPPFNVLWKDDKNYFFVQITKEDFPRIFITHQKKEKNAIYIGPFVDGKPLKKTLFFLRRIFPYYSSKHHPNQECSWCRLGLCPGPYPDKKLYKKNIEKIIHILKGKSPEKLLKSMRKEMKKLAEQENFEKAKIIRDQIFNLEKVLLSAKIFQEDSNDDHWEIVKKDLKDFLGLKNEPERIEGFDVSNIQGRTATGSMVVFIKGKPQRSEYRKFKIKTIFEPNDLQMTKEILERRFSHSEWPFPQIVVLDGGRGHLNLALKLKQEYLKNQDVFFISLAKGSNRLFIENRKRPVYLKKLKKTIKKLISYINKESHRFALSYHRKKREMEILSK